MSCPGASGSSVNGTSKGCRPLRSVGGIDDWPWACSTRSRVSMRGVPGTSATSLMKRACSVTARHVAEVCLVGGKLKGVKAARDWGKDGFCKSKDVIVVV